MNLTANSRLLKHKYDITSSHPNKNYYYIIFRYVIICNNLVPSGGWQIAPKSGSVPYVTRYFSILQNPEKMTNSEMFGMCLQDAAHDIDGATTSYTKGLKLFGSAERHLGTAERKFAREVQAACITPMKQFLAEDVKTAFKEKSHLDTLRLDLDVAKSKVNKTKTAEDREKAEKILDVSLSVI